MTVPLYDTLGREAISHIIDKGTGGPLQRCHATPDPKHRSKAGNLARSVLLQRPSPQWSATCRKKPGWSWSASTVKGRRWRWSWSLKRSKRTSWSVRRSATLKWSASRSLRCDKAVSVFNLLYCYWQVSVLFRLCLTGFYLNRLWEKTTTLNQWWVGTRTSRITSSLIILESGEKLGVPKFSVLSFPGATRFIFSRLIWLQPPAPEDLALVCFTSGTTGDHMTWCGFSVFLEMTVASSSVFFRPGKPKGAMLTHGNIISNTAAFLKTTEVNIVANFGICVWSICLQCSFDLILAHRPGFNNNVRISSGVSGPVISEIREWWGQLLHETRNIS